MPPNARFNPFIEMKFLSDYMTVLVAFAVVFITACTAQDQNNLTRPLSYEMNSVEKVYEGAEEEAKNETYCKVSYPVFSDGEHAEAINHYLLGWIADSTAFSSVSGDSAGITIEGLANNFFAEYDSFRKDFPVSWPYQFELTGSVLLNKDAFLTVDLSYYAYTGGAHGNSHTEYFVFDSRTGTRLGLNDVFEQGFEERLNKLIDRRYRQMKGLSPTDRLDGEKGMLFENFIHFNDNFALTEEGVSFFFNNYEITAYAFGPTKIDLPYSDLSGILKPEFSMIE
ncbi:MAG: DUF3298 and DUF4163 domain-containing protein [Chlorobium phaeobacteroides]|nr:DUF3298 and DUF4163 domain-containing protein [Chlorobium phaeobacteroides]